MLSGWEAAVFTPNQACPESMAPNAENGKLFFLPVLSRNAAGVRAAARTQLRARRRKRIHPVMSISTSAS
jgi:hypothetical protein